MTGIYSILILLAGFLSPERAAPPEHDARVVTKILLEEAAPSGRVLQTIDTPEEMAEILNYLRLMEKNDSVTLDPDSFRAGHIRILLDLSDGSFSLYHQLHRDYIQKNDGPWQRILAENDLLFPPQGHTMDMP
jgi:hypothetical protein